MKKYLVLIVLFCVACRPSAPTSSVKAQWSSDRKSIQVTGLPEAVIGEIRRDSLNKQDIYGLLPIRKMPVDTSLKDEQPVQIGFYDFAGDTISFVPDTPFVKNQYYFVRYYRHDEPVSLLDMVKGHKRPGAQSYTEWIFNY